MTMTSVQHRLEGALGAALPVLMPHGADFDHSRCGTTAERRPCTAWAISSGQQCPKAAAVVVEALPVGYVRSGHLGTVSVALCGGHFGVHRSGKSLAVVP